MPGARTACPSCGATVRPGATFCGQCYTDFRPAPVAVPPTQPAPSAAYGTPAPDPLTAPLLDVVLPPGAVVPAQAPAAASEAAGSPAPAPGVPGKAQGWPCSRCDHVNDFTAPVCTLCSAPFLAKAAEETKISLKLPLVGDLGRYGRGQRAAIAMGAIVALLLPLAIITLLLTKAPPKDTPPPAQSSTSQDTGTTTGTDTGTTTGSGTTGG